MAKPAKSVTELKEMIAAEFCRNTDDSFDKDSLIIVTGPTGWLATLRPDGSRIDEYRHAAIGEISRRIADGYDLSRSASEAAGREN